jgi:hypothetical protein
MRLLILAEVLLVTSTVFASDKLATCTLSEKSVVSRSPAGIAQVSNLGLIDITCSVPDTRPFPSKPGEFRRPLKVQTAVYQIEEDGSTKWVASEPNATGGGLHDGNEEVFFSVAIPLEFAERDAEARRLLAALEKARPDLQLSEEQRQKAIQNTREIVSQHRVGRFRLECHMMDGDREVGSGVVELEILFKGRFSDMPFQGAPPA